MQDDKKIYSVLLSLNAVSASKRTLSKDIAGRFMGNFLRCKKTSRGGSFDLQGRPVGFQCPRDCPGCAGIGNLSKVENHDGLCFIFVLTLDN